MVIVMKQRILTSIVGLLLLAVVMFFYQTLVFNGVIAVIILMAIWEVLHAAKITWCKPLVIFSMVFAVAVPFYYAGDFQRFLLPAVVLYLMLLFLTLYINHRDLQVEQIGLAFLTTVGIAFSLSTLVYTRDLYGPQRAVFYLLLSLAGGWMSDTGAYFVGCAIGKHKLSPEVSPKKKVEGAVGGVVVCTASFALFGWLYTLVMAHYGYVVQVNYVELLLAAPVLSVIGMLGDLSASVLKRQHNIKDYGRIMPGHGGIMDRFDSVLFVAPVLYTLVSFWPLVTLVA